MPVESPILIPGHVANAGLLVAAILLWAMRLWKLSAQLFALRWLLHAASIFGETQILAGK